MPELLQGSGRRDLEACFERSIQGLKVFVRSIFLL